MLGDTIAAVVAESFTNGDIVELEIGGVQITRVSEVQHIGDDLIRYQYAGQGIDHYALAGNLVVLRVRAPG